MSLHKIYYVSSLKSETEVPAPSFCILATFNQNTILNLIINTVDFMRINETYGACDSKYLSMNEVMQFMNGVYFYNFSYADVLLLELISLFTTFFFL